MAETCQSISPTYLPTISPNPADFKKAGAFAKILVSAMITSGLFAGYVSLKHPSVMGAEYDAKPSIEGAVAKIANALFSRNVE